MLVIGVVIDQWVPFPGAGRERVLYWCISCNLSIVLKCEVDLSSNSAYTALVFVLETWSSLNSIFHFNVLDLGSEASIYIVQQVLLALPSISPDSLSTFETALHKTASAKEQRQLIKSFLLSAGGDQLKAFIPQKNTNVITNVTSNSFLFYLFQNYCWSVSIFTKKLGVCNTLRGDLLIKFLFLWVDPVPRRFSERSSDHDREEFGNIGLAAIIWIWNTRLKHKTLSLTRLKQLNLERLKQLYPERLKCIKDTFWWTRGVRSSKVLTSAPKAFRKSRNWRTAISNCLQLRRSGNSNICAFHLWLLN